MDRELIDRIVFEHFHSISKISLIYFNNLICYNNLASIEYYFDIFNYNKIYRLIIGNNIWHFVLNKLLQNMQIESKFINDIVNNELQFHYEKPDLHLIKYFNYRWLKITRANLNYNTGPPGGYNSVRDTIVLVNGQPMMVQPSSTSGTAQKLPGPSILKNSSKTDLITSQQVWHDVHFISKDESAQTSIAKDTTRQ